MRHIIIFILAALALIAKAHSTTPDDITLKVLQMNLWVQGERVDSGVHGIIDVIDQTDPDIAFLCEISGKDADHFIEFLTGELHKRGKQYYGGNPGRTIGVLSKIKPDELTTSYTLPDEQRPNPVCKANIRIGDNNLTVYSIHLDWTHYECYMPRGYSGTTWKKIDSPATNADTVLAANRISFRDEAIKLLIDDAKTELDKGNLVIMGGDFNEPSHLDWQDDTKNLRDHNGLVINWDCSVMLTEAGYKDAFRELYPDAVTHPGFTFPAGNKYADLEKLVWVPDKDDRDRIDFIYYYPNPSLRLLDTIIVGPSQDIVCGQIVDNDSDDRFLTPSCIWSTDHKATLSTFLLH